MNYGSDWDNLKAIHPSCKMKFQWWQKNLCNWNSRSFLPMQNPTRILYVDSSNTGWGAHLQNHHQHINGHWSHEETSYHISWKEMHAVQLALQTYKINNSTIIIKTDNIHLTAQHISEATNNIADIESR